MVFAISYYSRPWSSTAVASIASSSSSSAPSPSSSGGGSIADLRQEYSSQGLEESSVTRNPFKLFDQWLDDAIRAQVIEPNAMCLSTVNSQGRPSARFVLLKGLDDKGFVWYTNYESRKGNELASNPHAALTFWWGDLERSVRVEGKVEKVSDDESNGYYNIRPRGSQLGAWASNQSRPIGSRADLEAQLQSITSRFGDSSKPVPRPPHWGGYRLIPDRIEFWKGRKSRLHDRIEFKLQDDGSWKIQRLQP